MRSDGWAFCMSEYAFALRQFVSGGIFPVLVWDPKRPICTECGWRAGSIAAERTAAAATNVSMV